MDNLIEIYQRLLREIVPSYRRKFYDDFSLDSRFVGVIGARGVGKTTFLINYLREHYSHSNQALYVSADNLYFVEHTLLETADRFVKEFAGQILCIDEVHKYKNWDQELKNIYDSYPKLSVIFSGSSSIDLVKGKYDLSRRAVLQTMYGFSFREFLEIKEKVPYPVLSFTDMVKNPHLCAKRLMQTPKLLGYLKTYLKQGYYPTFLELLTYESYRDSLRNIVDKTIYEDIASFYSLYTSNLDAVKKIIYFFATSQPGSVNINNLARSLKKDYTTIANFVQILKETGLLRFLLTNESTLDLTVGVSSFVAQRQGSIHPLANASGIVRQNKQGHALVRDAEKIFLDNTNLLYALNEEIGKEPLVGLLRELFVVSSLQNAGYHAFSSEQADIECNNYIFEIGGKSKQLAKEQKSKQLYTVKDDILIADPKTIPLYLFGFLS